MDTNKSLHRWKNNERKKKGKNTNSFSKRNNDKRILSFEEAHELYQNFDTNAANSYQDYPFSKATLEALQKENFSKPTAIQKASIIPALLGKDVLGAAKTGSGKTLAFVIPILECLHLNRWSSVDGPGALVISPTRELAYQTFEVLRKVGGNHEFSAGLIIGGKSVEEEEKRILKTNIVICTPGRLLQHMDQTHYFTMDSLKMLILDEADKLLEMGFEDTINAILANLPADRQTLLFSATQTKSIKSLGRLCLTDPTFVSVHAESLHSTPSGLKQCYIKCELSDKVNLIYSFIRNHVKTKILIFVNTCKQVQFLHAAFCRLRPGIQLLALHGKMNQIKRMGVYKEFCRKQFSLLFATDVAARGLDFPNVDWAVQLDCPDTPETYIHRAGRTARFNGTGNALLVLLPLEVDRMIPELKKRKVPIEVSEINSEKLTNINKRLQSLCAEDVELKGRAQRCFISYLRSLYLERNRDATTIKSLPLEDFSFSLGLPMPPRVRFLDKKLAQDSLKGDGSNSNKQTASLNQVNYPYEDSDSFLLDDNVDDDFISVKHKNIFANDEDDITLSTAETPCTIETVEKVGKKSLSKVAMAKRLAVKGLKVNQKVKFDEEGDVVEMWPPTKEVLGEDSENEEDGINIESAKSLMKERDVADRAKHQKEVQERHREQRKKLKEKRVKNQAKKQKPKPDEEAFLGSPGDEGDDDGSFHSDEYSDIELDNDDESGEDLEEEDEAPTKRRKLVSKMQEENAQAENFGLSLQATEDIALHFLNQ